MTKNLIIRKSHILPWEDADDYETLVVNLYEEYAPQGPTERHLVDEIAGIIWRKQRVGMAEVALHQHGLHKTYRDHSGTGERAIAHAGGVVADTDVGEAVRLSDDELSARLADANEDLAMTERALALAVSGQYGAALDALRKDTLDWWKDILGDGEDGIGCAREATAASMMEWLDLEALPHIRKVITGSEHAPAIRAQAFGESLNPDKFNEHARWEGHLDRRLEKVISLLMKLRNTREQHQVV